MSTNFPTGLDTNPGDPTPNETLQAGGHANLHTFLNDAMIAVQTYIGVIGSAVTSTLTYLLTNAASIDPGHKHTSAGISGTISVPKGGTGNSTATKGDIVMGNGTNTMANLAVGSDNQVVVADSTQPTGARWMTPSVSTPPFNIFAGARFGGTGADGALSITSGTTTLSAGGARFLIKNYTSISITGSGALAFSNPHPNGTFIMLRSQGNVTLTSSATPMINISNMGGAGAAGVNDNSGSSHSSNGLGGTLGQWGDYICGAGSGGVLSTSPPAAGQFGLVSNSNPPTLDDAVLMKYPKMFIGGGGGSGTCVHTNAGNVTSGAGGNGCGALVLECAGTLTFTGSGGLSVSGSPGGNGTVTSGSNAAADGGSGGGGGSLLILYNAAGTITGTVTTAGAGGGSGATSGSPSSYTHSSSSGGAGDGAGGAGVNRGTDGTGDAGVSGAASTYYLIEQNTLYA